MTKIRIASLAITCIVVASTAQNRSTSVKANGQTLITGKVNNEIYELAISTFTLPPDQYAISYPQCTGSRSTCSITKEIRLTIASQSFVIPKLAYADLSDIDSTAFRFQAGVYLLTIHGGDASEAYIVQLKFRHRRLIERSMYDAEDPDHPLEVSHYYSHGFIN